MKGVKMSDLKNLKKSELVKKLDELENTILTEKKSTSLRIVKKAIARIKLLLHTEFAQSKVDVSNKLNNKTGNKVNNNEVSSEVNNNEVSSEVNNNEVSNKDKNNRNINEVK